MGTIWQDIRYGFRMLLKSPGFSALAVLALALGIGANTAVFSVAIAFLKKPVSFPHLDRLVMVLSLQPQQTLGENDVSPADYFDWKRQAQSFEEIAGMQGASVNLTGNGDPEKLRGSFISANFFKVLGASPVLGRPFLLEEELVGHEQEAILTYGLWKRRFASDPAIVGKTVQLSGKSFTIVGVTGEDFNFPPSAQIFLPLWFDDKERTDRTDHYIQPVARLKPDVSLRDAQAEMFTILGRLQQEFPQTEKGWSVKVLPLDVFVAGELSVQYCRMLIGAVILVLLIACANVANLLFARCASRQKEIAVRRALGASRLRIVRQLLTESLLLAGAGAVIGLLIGDWGIGAIRYYMPPEVEQFLPLWKHVRLEQDVFLYTAAIALLAGVVSGLAPAFQTSKIDINEELKETGRGTTAGGSHQRLRSIFVVAEVSLSLILLIGAWLMVKGVRAMLVANPNLAPDKVLAARISLPSSKYKTDEQKAVFYDQVLRQFQSIPGVQSAAVATAVPFGDGGDEEIVSFQGHPAEPGEFRPANIESVNLDYFSMMRIPLREGRLLADTDGGDQPRVAVIGESFGRRYFAGENPIGKFVKLGPEDSKSPWTQIVGIVGDIKYQPYEREDKPPLYLPYRQAPQNFADLAIRTGGDPSSYAAAIRSRVTAVDPDQPIFEVLPLGKVIANRILGVSYVAAMLTAMGLMALVLASIGVYGVMAYAVTERTHEIGVRMALGAQPGDVLHLVLKRGVILTSIGLLVGLPVSFALAQTMSNLIFGVSSADLATFTGGTLLMCVVTLLACYVPARRAMHIDPMVALRHE